MARLTGFTPEQSFRVRNFYEQNIAVYPAEKLIASLAKELGRSEKSILSKLVREGLYKAKPYETKRGEKPVKKSAHAETLAAMIGLTEPADIRGLARANKFTLEKLIETLKK